MITKSLQVYLALERQMITFDNEGKENAADAIRDQMDPIWFALSDEDKEFLNNRSASDENMHLLMMLPLKGMSNEI